MNAMQHLHLIEAPVDLPHLQCPNRVIRSATHDFLGTSDGRMTEAQCRMYEALAENRVGTIISGHACVAIGGRATPDQTGIWDDSFIEGLAETVRCIHARGSRFIVQISHAGPRAVDSEDLADVTAREMTKNRHARSLTIEEIRHLVADFAAAAHRVQQAGADGVQLHAAHSYLLSRFLDPYFNMRDDAYGGSAENRFRMIEETIAAIRAVCGEDFPIFLKVNSDTKGDDAAYRDNILWIVRRCCALGVDLVELSGADFINQPHDARLYYLDRAAWLKREVPRQAMSLVGGVRSLADMEEVLSAGIDMVSLSRALIAEPDFVTKQLAGGDASICVSCCRCFVLPAMRPGVRCVQAWRKLQAKD